MSLYEFQHTLLKLYTKKSFLEDFIKNPELTIRHLDLTDREKKSLLKIPHAELLEFHEQLCRKRLHFAKKTAQAGNRIVAIPFHTTGTPILLWKSQQNITPITEGIFLLLEKLYKKKRCLSLKEIIDVYTEASPNISFFDVFTLTKMMYKHKLTGKEVTAR